MAVGGVGEVKVFPRTVNIQVLYYSNVNSGIAFRFSSRGFDAIAPPWEEGGENRGVTFCAL